MEEIIEYVLVHPLLLFAVGLVICGVLYILPIAVEMLRGFRLEKRYGLPRNTYWEMQYRAEKDGITTAEFNQSLTMPGSPVLWTGRNGILVRGLGGQIPPT